MYNVSFGAKINMTSYLDAGIKYAQTSATPKEQHLFLNCLKFIKEDTQMKTFSITGGYSSMGSATARAIVNDKRLYDTDFSSKQHWDSGYNCCLKALPDFIERYYGAETLTKLKNIPNELIQKCELIQNELDNALHQTKESLSKSIREFVKSIC